MYGMAWCGIVWHGMVWYGMVWYGMVWYGMVWYGMVMYDLFFPYPQHLHQRTDHLIFVTHHYVNLVNVSTSMEVQPVSVH